VTDRNLPRRGDVPVTPAAVRGRGDGLGVAPLERCGERLARLVGVGMKLPAPGRLPRRPGGDRVVIHDRLDDPLPEFEGYS